MTYHLGNNPPAASLAAPRTYGYFKFVDESSYEPWRGVPDMDVLPEPRDIRELGSPLFFKIVDSGGPVVTVTMMGRKNNVTNQVIRSVDASMIEKVRRFLAAIPRTIPTFTEEEVLATTRPLRISAPGASKPGASSGAMSYNTRIALGIGAGGLLLLVALGVTLGGRKRAGMQPNRKRTSRSRDMRPNDRRWEMQQYYQSQHGAERRRAIQKQAREDAALRMWGELTAPVTDSRGAVHMPSPDDRMAAIELVRQAYPDVDLWWLPRVQPNRSTVYAIPERKAYPITTSMDAYHATQRLKQGRVKSEDEARRIVAAIKREHHGIWTKYLKDYPVSRIMTSKRKGLAARRRA